MHFQPNRELQALESSGQPATPTATFAERPSAGLGVLTTVLSFLCCLHGYRGRKGSLSSGDSATGLVRKESCQKWDKWTDFSRKYLPFCKASVACNHRADPCPLSLWKRIPWYSVHCVFTNSLLPKITVWKIKCDGFI